MIFDIYSVSFFHFLHFSRTCSIFSVIVCTSYISHSMKLSCSCLFSQNQRTSIEFPISFPEIARILKLPTSMRVKDLLRSSCFLKVILASGFLSNLSQKEISFGNISRSYECHGKIFGNQFVFRREIERTSQDSNTSFWGPRESICPTEISEYFRVISYDVI